LSANVGKSIPQLFRSLTGSSRHGAEIPAIGLGTGGLGENCGKIVATALAAGYRHIDTARKYGTERGVGEAIRAARVPRDEIFLTTKVSHEDLHAGDFERSTLASLRALGLDRVDLLLVHWPAPDMPLRETMGTLAAMKRRGFTRHIGVANFNIALLEAAIRLCPEPLIALQAEYHPYLDQSKVLAACRRHGLIFVAYCPLARGRLIGDPVMTEIARAKGKTVAQVALRWLVQQDCVAAIPRSSNGARIAENIDVSGFALADDEMKRIAALKRPDGRVVNPVGRVSTWD
jgi:diketogulonate reductase-like aldo/keto reductase